MIGLTKQEMIDFFQKDFIFDFIQQYQSQSDKDPEFISSPSKQLIFVMGECMLKMIEIIDANNTKIDKDLASRGVTEI